MQLKSVAALKLAGMAKGGALGPPGAKNNEAIRTRNITGGLLYICSDISA